MRGPALVLIGFLGAGCGGGDDGAFVSVDCEPVYLLDDGQLTDRAAGYEYCEDAWVRTAAVTCAPRDYPACEESGGSCEQDSDCTALPNGECFGDWYGCYCVYNCESDDDCGPGHSCVCAAGKPIDASGYTPLGSYNRCVPSDCRTGADCASGECRVTDDDCSTPNGMYCQADGDECRTQLDCLEPGHDQCWYDEDAGHWGCTGSATCE